MLAEVGLRFARISSCLPRSTFLRAAHHPSSLLPSGLPPRLYLELNLDRNRHSPREYHDCGPASSIIATKVQGSSPITLHPWTVLRWTTTSPGLSVRVVVSSSSSSCPARTTMKSTVGVRWKGYEMPGAQENNRPTTPPDGARFAMVQSSMGSRSPSIGAGT